MVENYTYLRELVEKEKDWFTAYYDCHKTNCQYQLEAVLEDAFWFTYYGRADILLKILSCSKHQLQEYEHGFESGGKDLTRFLRMYTDLILALITRKVTKERLGGHVPIKVWESTFKI